ncbi:MAG: carboxylating nicotinate-nucleotide diphosphorylase [Ruminococcaceae bacterium]|nr:carboxylating nicotinate-nucleotide diphosphorylase [Oscillospiraceae bacterium]
MEFDKIILMSFEEDMPNGDITTIATVDANALAEGDFRAKDDGVVCGIEIARRSFELSGGGVEYTPYVADGDFVKKGDIIAHVKGNARSILMGERTALNLMQRASGIATATKKAVTAVEAYSTRITDTRKTMPGLRLLDKYAVRIGGAVNHRFGLSDGILIKDNHIAASGSITNAVKKAKAYAPHTLKIEVETENLEQVAEALEAGADIIMLDNMNCEQMKKAVDFIAGRAVTEASGNMGERDLAEVAKTGVDLISIGALTHSVKALDISLKFKLI